MKTTTLVHGLLAALGILIAGPALGQRMQFGTELPSSPATPPVVTTSPPVMTTSPPTVTASPPVMTTSPPVMTAPPPAAFQGTIQSPPPSWDPYAPPGANTPPTLLPQDPYYGAGPGGQPGGMVVTMQKFLQEIRFDFDYFPGNGGQKKLGIDDVELTATFAVPFLYNTQTPLLITPGFAVHYWNGPVSLPPGPPPPADMPAQTFDAYLDTAWHPQFTPWLGADLDVRIGVYSDFKEFKTESIRILGTGLAVFSFSPSFQIKAGIDYLDRNRIKLLPAGGIVWTPNQDVRFDILFPNPKFSKHLTTIGTTDWWWYVRGDYGGGAWTIKRGPDAASPGGFDNVDYNDIRVALGLEFTRQAGFRGLIETGIAFDRELYYASHLPLTFNAETTMFLRTSLAY